MQLSFLTNKRIYTEKLIIFAKEKITTMALQKRNYTKKRVNSIL